MLAIEALESMRFENLPPLTILTGEDLGQLELMKQVFLEKIGFDPSDLSYSYFDMKETPYETVAMDLVSLPFFSDEKIVILDHFQDVTTAKKRFLTDEDLQSLEEYLKAPVLTTKLVLIAEGKLDSKRRIVKLLKRQGQIFEALEPKEQELKTYFLKQAKHMGLVFAPQVFDQLLIKSGFHFSEISKNLAFLTSYKGTGLIEAADITEAIPKTLQDNLFDLTQMVLQKKMDQARQLVRDLTLQGEDEIKLISIMIGQFRIFTQVKLLKAKGQSEHQIVASLSDYLGRKVNPYQVKFALRDAKTLDLPFLKSALKILIETDYQIKTGVYDKDYLFEVALLKIASYCS